MFVSTVKQVINDARAVPAQNTQTVECRLRLTYHKLAAVEAKIYMFSTLKSMNLSTNDVSSFVNGQTLHKRVLVKPDVKVQKAAMKSKLLDALMYARTLRRHRDLLKKKISSKYSDSKTKSRKICSELVELYHIYKKDEMEDARKKIEHIRMKSLNENIIKQAPENTREFLSNVNVFTDQQSDVVPIEPEKPFICSKDITLTANELKVLARGPNFMVREAFNDDLFAVELEKSIAKQKYNDKFKDMEDDCSENENHVRGIRTFTSMNSSECDSVLTSKKSEIIASESDKDLERDMLWEEQSGKMVYDFKTRSHNLGNLKATDYKYNKMLYMPDPDSSDKENLHQFRRSECNRIYLKAKKSVAPKTSTNFNPKTSSKDSRANVSNDYNKMTGALTNPESNLSKDELGGLKTLRHKIKSGQLIIADTDKSKRFAALTPQQYIASGEVHTKNDIEIGAEKVKRIQNYVNDHVWWLKESSNIGSNWSHESRMTKNLKDQGEQVCLMTLLLKDHKVWTEDSGKPIPSRPVISGNNGLNCHLSELISLVIEPISFEHSGNEVDSTDDLIEAINKLNESLERQKSLNSEKISENNFPDQRSTSEIFPKDDHRHKSIIEKNHLKPNDIRRFGVSGTKTVESDASVTKKLRDRIEALRHKRINGTVIPDVAARLEGGALIDKLNDGKQMKINSDVKRDPRHKQKKGSGISIVGADVCSLFPSLKNLETARLARNAILQSTVNFEGWDLRKALRYLYIVGGP